MIADGKSPRGQAAAACSVTRCPRRSSWATRRRVAFGVAAGEVVATCLSVQLAGREHVPAGAEDRVLDGAECAAVAAPWPQPPVLRGEVDVVGAGRGQGRFGERGVEPLGAMTGLAGAAFAGGAVVAGALAGPGREMPLRWEAA